MRRALRATSQLVRVASKEHSDVKLNGLERLKSRPLRWCNISDGYVAFLGPPQDRKNFVVHIDHPKVLDSMLMEDPFLRRQIVLAVAA